jgi:hypothetical protein
MSASTVFEVAAVANCEVSAAAEEVESEVVSEEELSCADTNPVNSEAVLLAKSELGFERLSSLSGIVMISEPKLSGWLTIRGSRPDVV